VSNSVLDSWHSRFHLRFAADAKRFASSLLPGWADVLCGVKLHGKGRKEGAKFREEFTTESTENEREVVKICGCADEKQVPRLALLARDDKLVIVLRNVNGATRGLEIDGAWG
jgi:hypothetical protein